MTSPAAERPIPDSSQPPSAPSLHHSILFLCTGNYYRSRFAEICLNWHAGQRGLPWRADSRALALERGTGNVGPLSSHAIGALMEHGIPFPENPRFPIQVAGDDFAQASLVVALCEREHRPLMRERFAAWEDRVEYWQVEDVGDALPQTAMSEVERLVLDLCSRLGRIADEFPSAGEDSDSMRPAARRILP